MSDIRFEGWLHRSGTGGVYQDSAGNVGIASTQPKTRLDIQNGAFQIGPAGICTATTVNTTNLINATSLSHRNLIINGAMMVAQRGTSSTSSSYQTVDRFLTSFGGTDEAPTQAQVDVASGTEPYNLGFTKAFKVTNGNQTGGAGAADYMEIYTAIEDQDIFNSGWNFKSSTSYITISFWIKSSVSQKFPGFLYTNQAAAGDSYMYSYQVDNGSGGNLSADTWTKVTHSIKGSSSLSFNNDNTRGLSIAIFPFNGTNYTTSDHTENTWAGWDSTDKIKDMTSTWYTTNDATLEITGLQLEVGSVATPFEHRSYGEELARCKRYYQQFPQAAADNYGPIGVGRIRSSTNAHIVLTFPEMRSSPTVAKSGDLRVLHAATGTVVNSVASSHMARTTVFIEPIVSSGMTQGEGCILTANNDADGRITLSAEL